MAKFKTGDKVKINNSSLATSLHNQEGEIISDSGSHYYLVAVGPHSFYFSESSLDLIENTFKVGDEVEYIGTDAMLYGLQGEITSNALHSSLVHVSFYTLNKTFLIEKKELIHTQKTNVSWTTYNHSFTDHSKIENKDVHSCSWKLYFGLNKKFEYCEVCDKKRDVE
jgi:hypothetical protein